MIGMATAFAAFDPETLGISKKQWQLYSLDQQETIMNTAGQVRGPMTLPDNTPYSYLKVKIQHGSVLMPPFTERYPYQPKNFKIESDSCKTVKLIQTTGSKFVKLTACYIRNSLYLDPSPYKISFQYGVRFAVSPVWVRGFIYRGVNSHGYVSLKDADVTIKRIMEHA